MFPLRRFSAESHVPSAYISMKVANPDPIGTRSDVKRLKTCPRTVTLGQAHLTSLDAILGWIWLSLSPHQSDRRNLSLPLGTDRHRSGCAGQGGGIPSPLIALERLPPNLMPSNLFVINYILIQLLSVSFSISLPTANTIPLFEDDSIKARSNN